MIFILIPFIPAIALRVTADDNMGWRGSEIVGCRHITLLISGFVHA
jgi:hypothetical protein